LDSDWDQKCQETLSLLAFYGSNGTRYEDSRVTDMIHDTSTRQDVMDDFLRLLKFANRTYTEDMSSLSLPAEGADSNSPTPTRGSVRRQLSCHTPTHKAKRRKVCANMYLDIAAASDEEEEEGEDISGGLVHRPQAVGPSGKKYFQQAIDTLVDRFDCVTKVVTLSSQREMSQLPEGVPIPPRKSIYMIEFYSGMSILASVFISYIIMQPVREHLFLNTSCWEGLRLRHCCGFLVDCTSRLPAPLK